MPFYDDRAVYQDPILTNFSTGFKDQNLVGDALFPRFDVPLPSGQYRVFDRSDWLIYKSRRVPGTQANEIRGRKFSIDTYGTKEFALQAAVDDSEVQNVQAANQIPAANLLAGINPAQDATTAVTRSLLLQYELALATLATTAGNYTLTNTTALSGTAKWDAGATSNPMNDIVTAINMIYSNSLTMPNLMIIPWNVWVVLANHPTIIARFANIQASYDVAAAINLFTGFNGTILVPNAVYNSADNVDATATMTNIWGKNVVIAYVADGPSQEQQTFGWTFTQPYPDGNNRRVTRWREEARTSDIVRVQWRYDFKIVNNGCAYLYKTVIT